MRRVSVSRLNSLLVSMLLVGTPVIARADAVDALRSFVQDVKTGRAAFTQTVTSPDGGKTKTSSGSFEFARPDRFRFAYAKPFEQLIVADGQKVWIYDADLNQVSSRNFSQALGATPAALLAGGDLSRDFDLAALPSKDGLDWAQATPKAKDGAFQSMRIGFRGKQLAAVEIVDGFAQRSLLTFTQFVANVELTPQNFKFIVPKGADLLEQ
jgi:outer membrane lipoprotein carrier protein